MVYRFLFIAAFIAVAATAVLAENSHRNKPQHNVGGKNCAIRVTPARFFGFWVILFALVFSLCSCDDDLDVQHSYPFTVDVMPYPDKIANGETVELRMTIVPEGNYANTLYTIRYFQYEGKGVLKLVGGPALVSNDRVLIESKQFRLNYTARSVDSHELLITIEDNYGTKWEQTFEFNNTDNDVTPINPGVITPISN